MDGAKPASGEPPQARVFYRVRSLWSKPLGPIVPLLIADPDLRRVCYRAYNDWLAEFCATALERLVGAGLIRPTTRRPPPTR